MFSCWPCLFYLPVTSQFERDVEIPTILFEKRRLSFAGGVGYLIDTSLISWPGCVTVSSLWTFFCIWFYCFCLRCSSSASFLLRSINTFKACWRPTLKSISVLPWHTSKWTEMKDNRGRISSDGGALDCRARGREFVSWGWTNTQGLKISEKWRYPFALQTASPSPGSDDHVNSGYVSSWIFVLFMYKRTV